MKRILHIASFEGNIGDLWSHSGLYHIINKIGIFEIDRLEIRKAYANYQGEDKLQLNSLVEKSKNYEYIILGGGNFLELKWTYSCNGTTLDIPLADLNKIESKIILLSIGFDKYKYLGNDLDNRFLNWIKEFIRNDNIVSFRNDGSIDQFKRAFGIDPLSLGINNGWDNAFLLPNESYKESEKESDKESERVLGINVAEDMSEIRFKDSVEMARFLDSMAKVISDYIGRGYCVRFVPHIYTDLNAIMKVIDLLPEHLKRSSRWTIASLENTFDGAMKIWKEYQNFDKVIAMRFHANIAAIRASSYIIAVNSYDKIRDLYREVDDSFIVTSVDEFISKVESGEQLIFCKVKTDNRALDLYGKFVKETLL